MKNYMDFNIDEFNFSESDMDSLASIGLSYLINDKLFLINYAIVSIIENHIKEMGYVPEKKG